MINIAKYQVASPASNWKKDFSLQKYLNRFDLHIAETLKKNFLIRKRDHFTTAISDKMLKKAAKFAKRARSEIRFVEFNKVMAFHGMMEWQYKTKVSQLQ